MRKKLKFLASVLSVLFLAFFLLMIPDPPPGGPVTRAGEKPFAWNRDDMWDSLEKNFREEKLADTALRDAHMQELMADADASLATLGEGWFPPGDPVYQRVLWNFFEIAPVVAAGTRHTDWFLAYYTRVRNAVKLQSLRWDMNSAVARNTIYQLLYGMRAAVEEVLLQSPGMSFEPSMFVKDEASETPSARIFGITVHSGDLLVSRGGAVASALISRGNDYPGNFSHVAMIYVNETTFVPYLVEAHIERGVAVSTLEKYVADKKLRFMVLRPRADLPDIVSDPMIPQKAAKFIYEAAMARHIPYDFKMDFNDTTTMFCSEVASTAYQHYGIQLWQAVSTISSPGVVQLLNEFGVENFVTLMPSDLEYDPQLAVVAEWRDPRTLYSDHIYNAVMDVMLEEADKDGGKIAINPWMLPVARAAKGYSVLLNLFGREGPVPEGMSATQGLKNNAIEESHLRTRTRTEERATRFTGKNGYIPPYWKLVEMARESSPL